MKVGWGDGLVGHTVQSSRDVLSLLCKLPIFLPILIVIIIVIIIIIVIVVIVTSIAIIIVIIAWLKLSSEENLLGIRNNHLCDLQTDIHSTFQGIWPGRVPKWPGRDLDILMAFAKADVTGSIYEDPPHMIDLVNYVMLFSAFPLFKYFHL